MTDRTAESGFERFRRHGDLKALARAFDVVAPRLLAVARHLATNEAEAEDLVQTTFLTAIEHAARWDQRRALEPWLLGILSNKAKAARTRTPDPERMSCGAPRDPVEDAEIREFVVALENALERLPDAQRTVVRMHLAEGTKPDAIATDLDRAPGTVRVQLHRGLKTLRRLLPPGFALGGAVLVSSPKGLAAVREAVVAQAGAKLAAAAAISASTSTTGWLGGALMTKKILAGAAVVLIAAGTWWGVSRPPALEREETNVAVEVPEESPVGGETEERADAAETNEPSAVAEAPDAPSPFGALALTVTWHDGTPAPGVGVRFVPSAAPVSVSSSHHGTTNAEGTWFAGELPPGQGLVYVDRAQGFGTSVELVAGETLTRTVGISRGLDVRGTVVDASGRSIGGALVWMVDGRAIARTSPDGSFFVRSIAAFHGLFASAPALGISDVVMPGELAPQDDGARAVTLTLGGEGATVTGVVLDPTARPVAGARVRVTPTSRLGEDAHSRVFTDEAGAFEVDTYRGLAEIVATATGLAPAFARLKLLSGDRKHVVLRLPAGATVEGTVRDQDGAPIPSAWISVDRASKGVLSEGFREPMPIHLRDSEHESGGSMTDESGQFRLSGLPVATVVLRAQTQRTGALIQSTQSFDLADGSLVRWDPVLGAGPTIAGHAVDADGAPLVGWKVTGHAPRGSGAIPVSAATDDNGRFRLESLGDGPYRIRLFPPHQSMWAAELLGVLPGTDDLELIARVTDTPSTTVTGRVVAPDGSPLRGVDVESRSPGRGTVVRDETDDDGHFDIGLLPPGAHRIRIDPKGDAPVLSITVELAVDVTHDLGDIVIAPAGALEIVVANPGSDRIDLNVLDSSGQRVALEADGASTFRCIALPPGHYRLFVDSQRHATNPTTFEIRSVETTRMTLTLEPAAGRTLVFRIDPNADDRDSWDLHLVVRDSSGEIVLETDRFAMRNPRRDPAFYVANGFRPETYSFEADSPQGYVATGSFEVDGEESKTIRVDLEPVP